MSEIRRQKWVRIKISISADIIRTLLFSRLSAAEGMIPLTPLEVAASSPHHSPL